MSEKSTNLAKTSLTKQNQRYIDADAYENAAVVYALLYAGLLFTLWVVKLVGYFTNGPDPAVKALEDIMSGTKVLVLAPVAIFVLLIISNLRVVLGSLMCHSKSSELRAAIIRKVSSTDECLLKFTFMYVLIKSIAFVALVRSYVFGSPAALVLPSFLLIEAMVILYFDRKFKGELEEIDVDKWIRRNDWLFFWAALLWVLVAAWTSFSSFSRVVLDWTVARSSSQFGIPRSSLVQAADVIGEVLFLVFFGIAILHLWAFLKEGRHYKASLVESLHTTSRVTKRFVFGR